MRFYIGLVFLLLFSGSSFAADYYWTGPRDSEMHYVSAWAACPSTIAGSHFVGGVGPLTSLTPQNATNYVCTYSGPYDPAYGLPAGTVATYTGGTVTRHGDSCPTGGTYNSVTGACDMPQHKDGELCEDQQGHSSSNPMIFSSAAGKCVALTDADDKSTCGFFGGKGETSYTVSGVLSSGGDAVAPPTFAGQMGCEVATISTSECTVNVKGAISCNVTANFTGNVANTSGPDVRDSQCEPGACPPQEKSTSVEQKPCVMANGACTSETNTQTTGTQGCGTMNGNYICVTSKPSSDGTKIDTTVKSEVQPDGSVKTTKTDKATKTSCTDVNSCTLKNSTTSTVTVTDKTGQATSTTSTCFGACGSNGQGLGGSGSGGSGDGDGEGDGSASTSNDCKVPPPCDGDAYLCAILRQEALDSCSERALPTENEKSDFKKTLDKLKQQSDDNQKELDTNVTSLVSQFESASGNTGATGKCFEDKTFTIPRVNKSVTLPFSQVCPILEWFRYALIAVAFIVSLHIIRTEL